MASQRRKKFEGFKAPQDAAIVVVKCGEDVVLIRVPKMGNFPEVWKFPEGRIPKSLTPERAAVQRLWEKTGLAVDPGALVLLSRTLRAAQKGPHQVYFFAVSVLNLDGLQAQGQGGGETGVFPLKTIGGIANFHDFHRDLIKGLAEKKG